MSIISLEAKAIPKRIAAHPQALENVWNTTRLGYLSSLRGKTEPGKIIVSLIQHHQSFELTKYLYNFRTKQIITCRVIRRAKENQFSVFVGSRQQFIGRELEVIIQ